MINIYGTIGPSCADISVLTEMFQAGMTGIRLNTSHISIKEAAPQIEMIHKAASSCGITPDILIDMQGPELRIGTLPCERELICGQDVSFSSDNHTPDTIPIPEQVAEALTPGQQVLLNDGKILAEMIDSCHGHIIRGGRLSSGKSIALPGAKLQIPAMTQQDRQNITDAIPYGITGVMQPFVRDQADLKEVRDTLNKAGGQHISLLAKIENMDGVNNLESFFDIADEIVIARGDLGNAMPLWELPKVQKDISKRCLKAGVPYMVVTQMLASMEQNAIPTRAEVNDIYNSVCDGASSIMVTGETAIGAYPIEVIRYLVNTVNTLRGE